MRIFAWLHIDWSERESLAARIKRIDVHIGIAASKRVAHMSSCATQTHAGFHRDTCPASLRVVVVEMGEENLMRFCEIEAKYGKLSAHHARGEARVDEDLPTKFGRRHAQKRCISRRAGAEDHELEQRMRTAHLSDRGEEWSECCVGHRGLNAHISTHITACFPACFTHHFRRRRRSCRVRGSRGRVALQHRASMPR